MAAPATTPVGNAGAVQLGPGAFYVAPLGTDEMLSASATPDTEWREVGFTEDGSEFNYEVTAEEVYVAERFDPVKIATTKRAASISLQLAESDRRNLALALNAGAAAANSAQGLAAPNPGAEVRVMGMYVSENGAVWLFRRMFQGASVAIKRTKAPAKALIPVTFRLEIPESAASTVPVGSTGLEPFWVFPTAAGLI